LQNRRVYASSRAIKKKCVRISRPSATGFPFKYSKCNTKDEKKAAGKDLDLLCRPVARADEARL
jgi:hypothetical protein